MSDETYVDSEGYTHKKFKVTRLSDKQRDAFANGGEPFDAFAQHEGKQSAEADIEQEINEALRGMDPAFRKIALPDEFE